VTRKSVALVGVVVANQLFRFWKLQNQTADQRLPTGVRGNRQEICVPVIAVGKRDKGEVYGQAQRRSKKQ